MARTPRWERTGYDRVPDFIENYGRRTFAGVSVFAAAAVVGLVFVSPWFLVLGVPVVAWVVVGVGDMIQTRHTILRNFPVLGHLRWWLESMRPELRQYFVESDSEENPYSRDKRAVIYQRAKQTLDTLPFGTRKDVYAVGYEWLNHSMEPKAVEEATARVVIGRERCLKPYSASLLNISAMSFGSLSQNALLALNEGAKRGGFYHNTGEGGLSPYHLDPGGDLVWQIGTAYFGCRDESGGFSRERFKDAVAHPSVKMVELKLSQGAKPGHGGILPAAKLTPEIARIRGVAMGKDVISPPAHSAFQGPEGLLAFVDELRELSLGKPIGIKLCVGNPVELLALVKAMVETGSMPDFITVDGGEGGTGAAPLEFSDSVGMPLEEGLTLVHAALRGVGLRDRVVVISAGKIATGFHIVRQLALGADLTNSARGMMFALGCIQALKCNTNTCPTGIATQDERLMQGLVVPSKAERVHHFHARTVQAALELIGAAGLSSPRDLRPYHIWRRISATETRHLGEIHPMVAMGALQDGLAPPPLQKLWGLVSGGELR